MDQLPRPVPLGRCRWCAFTSAPSAGRVEIAYHTFPPFEGQGVATAMVSELLTRARQADPEIDLFAHTLPERNASTTILRKLGFEFLGEVTHPEEGAIWEWRRKSINQENPANTTPPRCGAFM